MRRIRFVGLAALLAAAFGVLPAAAGAGVSTSYSVKGVEIAASSTEGTFVGVASGSSGDKAVWKAVVDHTQLSPNAVITGGTLRMASVGPGLETATITATFGGGVIMLLGPPSSCGIQNYTIVGGLTNVATGTTTGGSGTFNAVLTHYRTTLFGQCITYAATVTGTVSFSF